MMQDESNNVIRLLCLLTTNPCVPYNVIFLVWTVAVAIAAVAVVDGNDTERWRAIFTHETVDYFVVKSL